VGRCLVPTPCWPRVVVDEWDNTQVSRRDKRMGQTSDVGSRLCRQARSVKHARGASTARPTDPFATLNESQRAAVEHGHDPLLVIGGAGSGKTYTLAPRVARLVLSGADPQRIMLVTFSRRARSRRCAQSGMRP